ncbi:MAG: glycosyltransferase family A protein, partial [Pantoea agglomerans]
MAKSSATPPATLPFVSVVCPTWNRSAFLPWLLYMFQYQDYPADRRELIIVDDSPQSHEALIATLKEYAEFPENIRYYYQSERMALGEKRNYTNALAKGEYILCMDDDDYYPPDRISYTLQEMIANRAIFAGCDQLNIWYSHINRIYKTQSMGPHHALNGTFAYHRSYLENHRYTDRQCLAEERDFLNGFT